MNIIIKLFQLFTFRTYLEKWKVGVNSTVFSTCKQTRAISSRIIFHIYIHFPSLNSFYMKLRRNWHDSNIFFKLNIYGNILLYMCNVPTYTYKCNDNAWLVIYENILLKICLSFALHQMFCLCVRVCLWAQPVKHNLIFHKIEADKFDINSKFCNICFSYRFDYKFLFLHLHFLTQLLSIRTLRHIATHFNRQHTILFSITHQTVVICALIICVK